MDDRVISEADINWGLQPSPHIEKIPRTAEYLLSLPKDELVAYVLDLREDADSLRRLVHATTTALASATEKDRRLMATIERLQEQLRKEKRPQQ
jgi:hypothetical protein